MNLFLFSLLFALQSLPVSGAVRPQKDAPDSFQSALRVEEEASAYTLYEARFPTARPSRFPANNTVWGHLFVPKPPQADGSKPACVLVLPVMAAPNAWIELRFVHAFLERGFAVLWIEMPYQFHRRPHPSQPSGQVFLARTAARLRDNFVQSVEDARRALTWLGRSGLVDKDRIGLFGISLGGMVAASLYSTDDRPKGAVLLLAGADFPSLVRDGSMTSEFVREAGIEEGELRRAWRGIDPSDHREDNRGKQVRLVNAHWDAVVPRANALKLKEAFPGSRQLWVPLGHYSAALHLPWIRGYATRRLAELLGPPASRRPLSPP